MSARPEIPRLSEEELDLLISRSLDGDLSPEETERLDRLVALDRAAARRKAELAALVAEVKALPEPATPFALTTRVTANVGERAGRPGSLGGRVGFFPAPGFLKAAAAILIIVGASIAILRPAPKRLAEGPVDVVLYDAPRPAASDTKNPVADSSLGKSDARLKDFEKAKASALEADAQNERSLKREREKEAGKPQEESVFEQKKAGAKLEDARRNEPAAVTDALAVAEAAPKQRADRDEGAALDGARAQAPAKVTNSAGLVSSAPAAPAAAPAPPPAPALRQAAVASGAPSDSPAPRGWTVSVRGDAGRRWALRRAPDNPPPARGAAVYRVTLDASGHVTALSRVSAGPHDPRLDAFVKDMVFELLAPPAELQSKVAAREAATPPADFEIGLEPR